MGDERMDSDRPWMPHHVPTLKDVRRAIGAQFPAVALDGLRHLGAGWEFEAYATTDGWVFRFPRRREAPAQLHRELAFLDLVRPALAPEFAVPRPELFGRPTAEFPFPFTGHRMIPGVPADHPDVPTHPDLVVQIATLLSRLHGIPVDAARHTDAKVEREGCRAWREEAFALVPALRDLDLPIDGALSWLLQDPPVPDPYEGPLRLIHNDLCPDHVIVNSGTGALVGLIDWTDTALGEPALDFTFLVTWRGWEFTDAVIRHYSQALDAAFRARLRYQARVASLVWLAEAVERGGDVAKHQRWVANAFLDAGSK